MMECVSVTWHDVARTAARTILNAFTASRGRPGRDVCAQQILRVVGGGAPLAKGRGGVGGACAARRGRVNPGALMLCRVTAARARPAAARRTNAGGFVAAARWRLSAAVAAAATRCGSRHGERERGGARRTRRQGL